MATALQGTIIDDSSVLASAFSVPAVLSFNTVYTVPLNKSARVSIGVNNTGTLTGQLTIQVQVDGITIKSDIAPATGVSTLKTAIVFIESLNLSQGQTVQINCDGGGLAAPVSYFIAGVRLRNYNYV